ncbi:hypothetical protein JCM3765_003278 [Sporobolomyces pararoseus]
MSSRSSTPKLQTSKQQQQPAAVPTRSNAPSPSPTPTPSPATSTPLPDLSTLLNLPLQVTTTEGKTIKATLYTYDPITSILVLSSPSSTSSPSTSSTTSTTSSSSFSTKRNYHLLKTIQINSLKVLSSTPDPLFPSPLSPLPSVPYSSNSNKNLSQKVQTSIEIFEKERSRLGPKGKTTDSVQKVFDLLSKTLPVRWTERGEIVVMDELVIDPSSGGNNGDGEWSIKGGKGSKDRIERVGKVLEGIRARVAANGGSQTPVIG